jgi:8-oxo-dGTP pyrophosphatase MutT (NUDIX family)
MTAEFLAFSKSRGNDLSTPVPAFGFPGLKPGDRWCLCAPRWQEAFKLRELPMPMSAYLAAVRAKVGHDLLTATAVSISVFNSDGRILLVRHADKGSWVIPGGAIDPNETPADAAVRECWEETGLFVEPMRIIGIFGGPEFLTRYPNGDVTYYTTIAFEARKISGSCKADGVETLDVRYFTKDECEHLTLTPESRLIAQRAFVSESAYFARATWSPGK